MILLAIVSLPVLVVCLGHMTYLWWRCYDRAQDISSGEEDQTT